MFLSPHLIIVVVFVSVFLPCFSPVFGAATDTLTTADSLSINQTLISAGRKFELGFFSKGDPKKYYVGIWYKDVPSDGIFVWVANRDAPLFNTSCHMKLQDDGNLVILDDSSRIRWTSNQSTAVNPVVQLLDSGNLVIREADDRNPDHYLWQSFDHPTDTLLPGQKIGWNLKTGMNRIITSWKGPEDPGSGQFSAKLDYRGDPEFYLWQGDKIIYRSGPWVGEQFSGQPEDRKSGEWGVNFSLQIGPDEVYYTYQSSQNEGVRFRMMLSYDGSDRNFMWVPNEKQWVQFQFESTSMDECNSFSLCGANGICSSGGVSYCQCPQGFKPKNPQAWAKKEGLDGCVRNDNLECKGDWFLVLENMKLPQTLTSFVNESMTLDQCRDSCKTDCNCTAYANSKEIQGVGTGCIRWTGNLIDMRNFSEGGQRLFVRLAASNLDNVTKTTHLDRGTTTKRVQLRNHVLIAISALTAIALLSILIWMRIKRHPMVMRATSFDMDEIKSVESLQFDLNSIRAATRNFSDDNKLGEGGFGEVYKGELDDGQEIAVKRLLESSRQGTVEFKTEVLLVAKLQHKNLVKLLGFCLGPKEKILIYEYLRNSSLDKFLFDSTRKISFNWQVRIKIIAGIARGLMYLHEDSRFKIIHRDLKPSNILLDESMNPKIADFGLAKLFTMDQTQDDTKRIVGTYGYMAPEYAMTGHFSVKSDVYSFGVIVLEIVTGQRNKFFGRHQLEEALLYRAWRLWNEEKALELVDVTLGDEYPKEEVKKCIQIGLLSIQESAAERPRMATIVAALSGQSVSLPMPKPPSFLGTSAATLEISTYSGTNKITDVQPR